MKIFVFDLETSGLIENATVKDELLPDMIEFYGCLVDLETGEVSSEVDTLVKPRRPISEEITRITGLTNEDLETAPSMLEVAPTIKAAIEAAPAVLAHNASFDVEVTSLCFKRVGVPLIWPKRRLCTVEQTIHMKGHRLSLTALHTELFGEGFPAAHRAKNDVMALVEICKELFRRGDI
jgi:DNA polymerase-3 subunit alpha (Gram-positive type)